MDKFTQYAMVASQEAIDDSGLDFEKENKDRVGVIWGAGIGGLETFQNEVLDYAKGDGTPRVKWINLRSTPWLPLKKLLMILV